MHLLVFGGETKSRRAKSDSFICRNIFKLSTVIWVRLNLLIPHWEIPLSQRPKSMTKVGISCTVVTGNYTVITIRQSDKPCSTIDQGKCTKNR